MLLRRVTQHVKTQNWLAVSIDFLVVVAGIFIGLQVTEWDRERRDHADGIYYLNRLDEQLASIIEAGAQEIESSQEYANRTRDAGLLLHKEVWSEDEKQSFQVKHAAAFRFWGPEQKPAVLRRLVDDGKLDLVESREIQAAILDLESVYVEAIQQTRTSYNYSRELTLQIMNAIRYSGLGVISTPDELRASQPLKAGMRGKYIFQAIQLRVLQNVLTANMSLKEVLEGYLRPDSKD